MLRSLQDRWGGFSNGMRGSDSDKGRDLRLAVFVTGAFVLWVGWTAAQHEMWRDEIQAWLLARDSTGPIDLHRHLKYEGHPGLWHLLLLPVTRLSWSPVGMQFLHLAIAAAAVFLFTRYAPFHPAARVLFAFGYFPSYEYAVICRNYGVGMLLLFAFAALFQDRFKRFHWIGAALLLACHTSVHALIVVIALAFGLTLEALMSRREIADMERLERRRVWIGFALIGVGILTAVLQLKPPPDYDFAVGWHTGWDPKRALNMLDRLNWAYFMVPKENGWGSHALYDWGFYNAHKLWFSVGLASLFLVSLWRRPSAALAFGTATVGLLTFFYMKYPGSIRHHGFLYLSLAVLAWTGRYWSAPLAVPRFLERFHPHWKRAAAVGLAALFAVQAYGGIRANRWDRRIVFSRAQEAAQYLRKSGYQDAYIVAHEDAPTSAIVGYLENERFYYTRASRFGSFVRWDRDRGRSASYREVAQTALDRDHETIIAISGSLSKEVLAESPRIHLLREIMGPAAIGNERYNIYLVRSAKWLKDQQAQDAEPTEE